MQVPLIDRLNDLQVGFNSLQNPSFPSPITSSLAGIQSVSVVYNFCKWGAVFLALVATFSSIINRVTVFIIRFRSKPPSLPSISLFDDDFSDISSDDGDVDDLEDDDDTGNDSSSEFDDEPSASASSSFLRLDDFFFRVRGTAQNDESSRSQIDTRHRSCSIGDIFSLAELASSDSVVKLWDTIGFGLGLDFDDYEESPLHAPASSSTASPAVVVSAAEGSRGNLEVGIWDTRLRKRRPSVVAEWGPAVGKTVRVESGGVSKVYVRDNGRDGVTVGDMRKVSKPLGNVTESDADNTWWDASEEQQSSMMHQT
ncbi:uncharacterized protein LOC130739541 [Lotus japonicus]|uniref:uncharacterized protein LOC130739541 n=1 Tax=Lotus japonicus TaxID=34305 RepID=UPI0003E6C69E|nr:uncharacterized protein LOC130739541 [Lotus japonicus]